MAVLLPALLHGASLGPFDLLSRYGLSQHSGVRVHNSQTTDLIAQMIPWTSLAWTQVHHGHIPLWNPYNGLGMPLAFNWQSATFGLPTLLGYLAPLRLAYTVQVVVTLVLAGTGTYVLGRVLGLGVTASVMAGVVYELSGTFMGFLGWPIAGVLAWSGWLFAAALLIVRGKRRVRAVVFFALVGGRCGVRGPTRRPGPARTWASRLRGRAARWCELGRVGASGPCCVPWEILRWLLVAGACTGGTAHSSGRPFDDRIGLLPRRPGKWGAFGTRRREPHLPGLQRPAGGSRALVRCRDVRLCGSHRVGAGRDGGGRLSS